MAAGSTASGPRVVAAAENGSGCSAAILLGEPVSSPISAATDFYAASILYTEKWRETLMFGGRISRARARAFFTHAVIAREIPARFKEYLLS